MYRELRHVFHEAIGKELTDDQHQAAGRAAGGVSRVARPGGAAQHLKAIGDELGLTADQKEQMKKIHSDYDNKTAEPTAALKELREEEHAAVDKNPHRRAAQRCRRCARNESRVQKKTGA